MESNKIILFGGTFDPVHIGHVVVAEHALKQIGADKVIFIPVKRSPHKNVFPIADGTQRCEMIRLAISGNDKLQLSECELKRPDPSYTLETVKYFREKFGSNAELYWLVGADVVKDLPKWYRFEDLTAECTFCVMQRGGFTKPDFSEFSSILRPELIQELYENVIFTPLIDISSTEIRGRLSRGESVGGHLTASVRDYITKNGLYSQEKGL